MFKRLKETPLTNYASTRLIADEKMQLVNIATQCGKKQSVILREAFRLYLSQSVLIPAQKIDGGCRQAKMFYCKVFANTKKPMSRKLTGLWLKIYHFETVFFQW